MPTANHLKVAALVDLPRSAQAGGHVKGWERLAAAAANTTLPLELTVYFSGPDLTERLGPRAVIRQLPPVFSTSRLKFLPYIPDHTDLAPYHFRLARELKTFDVLHATDGFFAFARTAERVSHRHNIPLVTSFHTDTPSYARIFTRRTIERLFGTGLIGHLLNDTFQLPERQERAMIRRLKRHLRVCRAALATREEDIRLAQGILGAEHVRRMRLGVDKDIFNPRRRDRAAIERDYNIPEGRIALLFVGRLDAGKNIYPLIEALESLIKEGLPLHLVTAGIGPAAEDVKQRLAGHASVPGFVPPQDLARLYAGADVFVMPSEVEIRSQAANEALASGCPVLMSAKSGMAALFNNAPALRTVESGAGPWTEALRAFATDPALRDNMRAAAMNFSQKHALSWHDILAQDLFATWREAFSIQHSGE